MSIWFTSDNHFFHKNVIKHCNRPFETVTEMHEKMIEEWNKRVKTNEHIYVLGDFAFAGWTLQKKLLDRLQGHKILIKGNHDLAAHKMLAAGFNEVHENVWITIGNKRVLVSHFPFHPMTRYQKNSDGSVVADDVDMTLDRRYLHKRIVDDGEHWLIHGHVHCAWKQSGRQINVGVDQWDFKPVNHEKILAMIEKGEQFIGNTKVDD